MSKHEGPYFDDLQVGDVFDDAPALTLTNGDAAVHRSILGSRLRLSLDHDLSQRVTGRVLADPSLVWDVSIGQSTVATRRVVANLFYRGLAFRRFPAIGDTLHTTTTVVGLKQNSSGPTGLAALRISTRDQEGRQVLDFWRCAMLPLSSPDVNTGHHDDLAAIGDPIDVNAAVADIMMWDLASLPASRAALETGQSWTVAAGDVVLDAPQLARTTLNLAHVHHDEFSQPSGRLVYGGHTIGIALAQLTRTLPDLVTIGGWHSCDHLGPVREGDTLTSRITIEHVEQVADGFSAATTRIEVDSRGPEGTQPVLDWRLLAISA